MKIRQWCIVIPCVFACLGAAMVAMGNGKPVPAEQAAEPNRWESQIQAFEQWDRKNSFPKDAVLFVGSSSIAAWPTAESFPGAAVLNRGFGGSTVPEALLFADRIIFRYAPKVIVFYSGDNDIGEGKEPPTVFEDYQRFVEQVRAALPDTAMVILAIKPSPMRWALWPKMREVNAGLAEWCPKQGNVYFVDTASLLLDDKGEPIESLYTDRLHLTSAGYARWNAALRPLLMQLMNEE